MGRENSGVVLVSGNDPQFGWCFRIMFGEAVEGPTADRTRAVGPWNLDDAIPRALAGPAAKAKTKIKAHRATQCVPAPLDSRSPAGANPSWLDRYSVTCFAVSSLSSC